MGRFLYSLPEDVGTWSDGMFHIHDTTPAAVVPTTRFILDHKHPEDRDRAAQLFERVATSGEPFSFYHRIVDCRGHTRRVVTVGSGVLDERGHVSQVRGFLIDLTAQIGDDVADAVAASAGHRAAIEQAKGVVMAVYGIDSAAAFALLRWHSQTHNTKVSQLAERLDVAVSRGAASDARTRNRVDKVFSDVTR